MSGCAARLVHTGIRPGNTVLVQLSNQTRILILTLALVRLGARPVLALPALREHELETVITALAPTVLAVPVRHQRFDHLRLAEKLRERHPSVRLLLVSDAGDRTVGHVDIDRFIEAGHPPPAHPGRLPSDTALFLLSSGTTGVPKPSLEPMRRSATRPAARQRSRD